MKNAGLAFTKFQVTSFLSLPAENATLPLGCMAIAVIPEIIRVLQDFVSSDMSQLIILVPYEESQGMVQCTLYDLVMLHSTFNRQPTSRNIS